MDVSGSVLLFDGECALCLGCVKWLLMADRKRRLRFAPLQGRAAQDFLRERGLPRADFDSIIFIPNWLVRFETPPLFRTDAWLAALREVGGVGWLFAWLRLLPRAWRDPVYRVVAKWRQRWFGAGDGAVLYSKFAPERFLR